MTQGIDSTSDDPLDVDGPATYDAAPNDWTSDVTVKKLAATRSYVRPSIRGRRNEDQNWPERLG